MKTTLVLDKIIFYCLLLFALSSSISIAGTNIALSLAILFALIRYSRKPAFLNVEPGLLKAIGYFLLTVLISAIFSQHVLEGFNRLWAFFYRMIPLFLAIQFIRNKEQLSKVIVTMAVSLMIADNYAIWQGLHGDFRAAAFSSNAMLFGGYLVQMIPFLTVLIFEKVDMGKYGRWILTGCLLLSAPALIINGTKGAWIALFVVLAVYAKWRLPRTRKSIAGVVLFMVIIVLLFANSPQATHRFQSLYDTKNQSTIERVLIWQSSWHMFQDHPITGVGVGSYPEFYQTKYILPKATERLQSHAHNNFLMILAEMGIIGLSGFIYMFGYILYRSYRLTKQEGDKTWGIVLSLVTVSLLLQGLTEYNFGDSAVIRMYWFIVGLSFSAYHISRIAETKLSEPPCR